MDYSKITFKQIKLPFAPDYNGAAPEVSIEGGNVILQFEEWMDDRSSKVAKMQFVDCVMYRVGSPNEDGFSDFGYEDHIVNNSIYCKKNFPELELHKFYEVFGVDWKSNLIGVNTVVLQKDYRDLNEGIHYVFFMKDGTFECIARDFKILEF